MIVDREPLYDLDDKILGFSIYIKISEVDLKSRNQVVLMKQLGVDENSKGLEIRHKPLDQVYEARWFQSI